MGLHWRNHNRIVSNCLGRPYAIDRADVSANIPIEEPETSYLCWLSSLAVALSDRAGTQQAIDVRGKSAQELLAHKMFQSQRSQIPPLVLALGFQLVGWCLAPQTLPEVFESDRSVFEAIMADIDFFFERSLGA